MKGLIWMAAGLLCATASAAPNFVCEFDASVACGFIDQQKAPGRASLVSPGRSGGTALRLVTQPGDNNVVGSGDMERADIYLPQAVSWGYQGQEQWWAHSVLFPTDFALPTWQMYVIADFHHTGPTGQANMQLNFTNPSRLEIRINGQGRSVRQDIGPITKNRWYDFVYHVKWSSGADGFFDAWVNGVRKLAYQGPTLYTGLGTYLKLANYHTPVCDPYPGCTGPASAVIHDRVLRGTSASDVSIGPLQ